MMEDHRPLTSQDGVIYRNPPERCPRPLYSQDCPEGNVPENHQNYIKVEVKGEAEEETDFGADHQYGVIDRNPPERCPRPLYSQDCPEGNVPENYQIIKVKVKDEPEEEMDFWADEQYGVIDRNPPERCPRPLYSQDCPEGNVTEKHQGEDLMDIKVEVKIEPEEETDFGVDQQYEERMRGHHPCMRGVKEEIPGGVTPENPSKNSEGNFMLSLSDKGEDEDMMERSSGEDLLTPNVYPDLSYNNPPDHEEPSPDQPHIVTTWKDRKGEERIRCDECAKQFTERSDLVTPRSHTGENRYSCSECGKCFTFKSNLLHERSQKQFNPYSCSECGKYFTFKSQLVAHERNHTGEKPYLCSECGKCFKTKAERVQHERRHTGEKPYSCSECGKCFTRKSDFVLHEKSHKGLNPYSCSKCGKCFTGKSQLVIHERSHTGEKPYSCTECGKCFTNKSNLVVHERNHTGEKPYSCSECGKCFKTKADHVKHERRHTGERPYSCSYCGKCFRQKSHLLTHERIHTGEKPYSCSECGKSFAEKSSLVKHERNHTRE